MQIKQVTKIYLIFLSLFMSSALAAQVDTRGTDFWVSFGNNANGAISSVTLQIRIVADKNTSGTITFTNLVGTGKTIPFNITAGSVYTYTLSDTEKQAVYNTISGISNKSIQIQSSVPVTVYALNTYAALADATNLLPTTVLGDDYYHLGWLGDSGPDQYMVIAVEDNTTIYQNGNFLCSLSVGEMYLQQASVSDMSGYHITSNKPIAYFSAHAYARINGGGDNFFQQLPSVNTWGKNFLVPVTNREVELVRIIASQDGTTIHQEGGVIKSVPGGKNSLNLNAGEWVQLEIKLADNGCYIQADKPVQVCSYMVGTGYPGAVNTYGADESLAWIPPIEQTINSALIAPFAVNSLTSHFALIVTPTATKNNTRVSIGAGPNQPLSGGIWYDNVHAGMSFYSVQLENSSTTSYLFSNPDGLIVYAYGFGHYISYYYLAGSAMRDLSASFYANNVHNQDLPSTTFNTHSINFRAEINGVMSPNSGHLKWYINNVEELAARDQLTWSKNLPNGIYPIKIEVLQFDNLTIKTIESTLNICALDNNTISSVLNAVCQGSIPNTILGSTPTGGTNYGYIWQSSTDNLNFSDISGANNKDYTPASLLQTTYYRRIVYEVTSSTCILISNSISISVYPVINPGSIGNEQTICSGTTPEQLVSLSLPSGGTGLYSYQWESSSNGVSGWINVTGVGNTATYTPDPLSSTTYYRRVATSGTCHKVYSNTVSIIIEPLIVPSITITATPN